MLGREAAERATKLREVERLRGRLGFLFAISAKNEEWRDLQLVSRITFFEVLELNGGKTPIDQNNRTCVRFSCVDRKSKFVYSVLK